MLISSDVGSRSEAVNDIQVAGKTTIFEWHKFERNSNAWNNLYMLRIRMEKYVCNDCANDSPSCQNNWKGMNLLRQAFIGTSSQGRMNHAKFMFKQPQH